jgi:hypothetical protein
MDYGQYRNTMSHPTIREIQTRQNKDESPSSVGFGEVGIFWIYKKTLIQESVPISEGEDSGDYVNGPVGHYMVWRHVQEAIPELRAYEYDQVPRGRVLYSKADKRFYVYGPKEFLKSASHKRTVLSGFNIPDSQAVFRSDEHYATIASVRVQDVF